MSDSFRYELVDGDTRIINIMSNDGWEMINTFANPHPQPYFFALMRICAWFGKDYSVENVQGHVHRGEELNPWAANTNPFTCQENEKN